jgi:hypothetical protein
MLDRAFGIGQAGRVEAGYYDELRGRLVGLLIQLEDRLPPADRTWIEEFIDQAEYGIALERMCELLGEATASISAKERSDLLALGATMGISPSVGQILDAVPDAR